VTVSPLAVWLSGGSRELVKQQTAITRKLAAWAAILAVPTAIAGIYGMNFEHMPELKWTYGYFLVIGVIAAICGTLYWRFRRTAGFDKP
jgi:magnesium transporter